MEQTTLTAEMRTVKGKRRVRALRRTGRIPAIVYGHGEPPQSISLSSHDVDVALAHGVRTLALELDGSKAQYLIKDVQYDPLGEEPIHMDLTRVSLDERVKVRVGIELRGVPKGVTEGGALETHMADLEVECRVMEIPGTIHPLVTELGVGDALLVKDLELPPGVTALADPDDRVASVRAALEEEAPEETATEEGGTAEPERIGRVRKDEEEKPGA